jgi:hypothetical protein
MVSNKCAESESFIAAYKDQVAREQAGHCSRLFLWMILDFGHKRPFQIAHSGGAGLFLNALPRAAAARAAPAFSCSS